MIVLDTNVISELMRAQPSPSVVSWVDRQLDSTLYLTVLTLAEIRFGIAALPKGRRRTALTRAFEDGIRPLFADRILNFDEQASIEYAELRANAHRRGVALSDVDALIGAIVRTHRCQIATRDEGPFKAAGLHVINPFTSI